MNPTFVDVANRLPQTVAALTPPAMTAEQRAELEREIARRLEQYELDGALIGCVVSAWSVEHGTAEIGGAL